jgi:inosine/xanthosine triphosphate pyrophosphatase family protein
MPQHVARLVTRLVAPLIVDYSGLAVDYFNYAARPGASARRAARHAPRRATRRRLLRLAQARHRPLHLAQARH